MISREAKMNDSAMAERIVDAVCQSTPEGHLGCRAWLHFITRYGPKLPLSPPVPARQQKHEQNHRKRSRTGCVAEYFCIWIKFKGNMKKKMPTAA
jgi:hypothetical protein